MSSLLINWDNDQYKQTITSLVKEKKVPVLNFNTWENFKDYYNLGLLSSTIKKIAEKKGKEGKIIHRCFSTAILDWGEETDDKKYLEEKEFKK